LFFPFLNPFVPNGKFTYCELSNATISDMRPLGNVDGTFLYCALSNATISDMRPLGNVDGTFLYCAFDINNSGFDRIP
jgi:type VI protein secretion system component Hcp